MWLDTIIWKIQIFVVKSIRCFALSAEWKKMTYQESFTTQYEDILVYEQPQPQQSPRDKAWDPHPEVNKFERKYLYVNGK